MDLNMPSMILLGKELQNPLDVELRQSPKKSCGDTTLRLDCLGYGMSRTNLPLYSKSSFDLHLQGDGCHLALGLSSASPSCHLSCFQSALGETKESATHSDCSSRSGTDSKMLELGLSCGAILQDSFERTPIAVVDEGSTSAKRSSGGYIPSLLFAPRFEGSKAKDHEPETCEMLPEDHGHLFSVCCDPSATTNSSAGTTSHSSGSYSQSHDHHLKKCRFSGCSKGARGASGLCIAHGGGQRCQKPGCSKGAESSTVFCKAHGGGKRCQKLGCTKSADSKTDYCIAHGGGQRCDDPGCTKAARGKSGLCIRHGGGKRCTADGCNRSAEGQAGLCISHGGGRRCQYAECTKGAQGSTIFCKAHGGGKRCVFEGCTKGAEGSTPLCKGHGGGKRCLFEGGGVCSKSVHGGTNYCVAHGGGKRCAITGCTRSARGRTTCCVRHGGGKRCRFEGCTKSAQGSTDFCKAHGGGKRCKWHQACEKFARGKSGLCTVHSNMAAWRMREVVPTIRSNIDNDNSASEISTILHSAERPGRQQQQQLSPPQVQVPLSMKTASSLCAGGEGGQNNQSNRSSQIVIPEGRVHGGGLLFLLGGTFRDDADIFEI
ncbi:hornerin-like [Dendrobium catenatum]|nr:hornerin-like [Dendrobium catenatum]XP_028555880.1 hornerin-like [Dendrobium catenatum]